MIKVNSEKRNFDNEAASWDKEPGRVKIAKDIAKAISEQIMLTSDMDVLDFGCGTGLLTFELQSLVHSITGVDSSQGMLNVFKAKIEDHKLTNVRAQYLDIDKGDVLTGSYHLIVSGMTFHHIKDIRPLLDQFHKILVPSGYLCIADLDLDAGQFHSNNEGVFHFGFDRAVLRQVIMEAGFQDVRDVTAADLVKPVRDQESRRFTIFLLTSRK